jgi:hypothetical protein
MPLLDALLLDPYRMNVWIAARTDGVTGTGTHNDPYDGSTQAKFDALMNGVRSNIGNNTCVHLGPGTFYTNGYADGVSGGWQAKPAMKIVGCGMDFNSASVLPTGSNIGGQEAPGKGVALEPRAEAIDGL